MPGRYATVPHLSKLLFPIVVHNNHPIIGSVSRSLPLQFHEPEVDISQVKEEIVFVSSQGERDATDLRLVNGLGGDAEEVIGSRWLCWVFVE